MLNRFRREEMELGSSVRHFKHVWRTAYCGVALPAATGCNSWFVHVTKAGMQIKTVIHALRDGTDGEGPIQFPKSRAETREAALSRRPEGQYRGAVLGLTAARRDI
jgi:hypothetical protein